MKRIFLLLLLLLITESGFSFEAFDVSYSDFQWIDDTHLLLTRVIGGGAYTSFTEVIILDIITGKITPLAFDITGYSISDNSSKLFFHSNYDIVEIDFNAAPLQFRPVFNHKNFACSHIQRLNWVMENSLSFYIFSSYDPIKKVLFNIKSETITDTIQISYEQYKSKFFNNQETAESSYPWPQNTFSIQIATNKEFQYAEQNIKKMRKAGYQPFYFQEDEYFVIKIGFFEGEDQAQAILNTIKNMGYQDAFIAEEKIYTVDGQGKYRNSIYYSNMNCWYEKNKIYIPVFEKNAATEIIGIINSELLLTRNRALYSVSLKDYSVKKLTISSEENGTAIPFFDKTSGKIIIKKIPEFRKTDNSYWEVNIDGSEPSPLTAGSDKIARFELYKNEWSLDNLENIKELNQQFTEFSKTLPSPSGRQIMIQFTVVQGYWANRLVLKEGSKETILLDYVKNW